MDQREILSRLDHTILTPDATWEQVRTVCDEGRRLETASVCVPPRYVKRVNGYVGGSLKICTVVGFPNGYTTPEVKVFETEDAIRNGADEIDMVINLGWVKDRRWEDLLSEIRAVKAACGSKVLKVIIECCMLTDEEKIRLCGIVTDSGADYIKTSTGFGGGGALREDVALFARHIGPHVKIKAAGGIAGLQDAEDFIALGASRLGTSRIVRAVRAMEAEK